MNRTRTTPSIISYRLYLYFSSRSFRLAAKCLSSIIRRSHVAIWKWLQRYSFLAGDNIRFRPDRHAVKEIIVDEILVRIDGYSYACIVATDNRLVDWAIWANFPRGYFYRNPDSTITDACTVDLNAPLGVSAMEVLHMVTGFGDLYGVPDSPGGFDIMDCSCGVHHSSYTKRKFGWLDINEIVTVTIENRNSHIILEALANPLSRGGARAAIVPIQGTQAYFMVEARLMVDDYERSTSGVSSGIPQEGVVVYWIDESSWPPFRKTGKQRSSNYCWSIGHQKCI